MDDLNPRVSGLAAPFREQLAEHIGAPVSFDLDGIYALEEYLLVFRSEFCGQEWEAIREVAMGMSAFFAECLRHELGGEYVSDEQSGYALQFAEGQLFPTDWVMKLIEDDQEAFTDKLMMALSHIPGKTENWLTRQPAGDDRFDAVAHLEARGVEGLSWKTRAILNHRLAGLLEEPGFSGVLRFEVPHRPMEHIENLEARLGKFAQMINDTEAQRGTKSQGGDSIAVSFELLDSDSRPGTSE